MRRFSKFKTWFWFMWATNNSVGEAMCLCNVTAARFFPFKTTNKKPESTLDAIPPHLGHHKKVENSLRCDYRMNKQTKNRREQLAPVSTKAASIKQKEIMRWLFSNVIRMNERSFVLGTRAVLLLFGSCTTSIANEMTPPSIRSAYSGSSSSSRSHQIICNVFWIHYDIQ